MPLPRAQLIKRAKKIKLLAMDIDGVLTNGDILILDSGEELKTFNAKDRLVLSLVRDEKVFETVWVTGRSSKSVEISAENLGIGTLVQKCMRKKQALEKVIEASGLGFESVAFVGDDLIDIPAMQACGFSACPADATSDAKKNAHYISPLDGGRGVVRDVIEFILRAQGRWDKLVSVYLR